MDDNINDFMFNSIICDVTLESKKSEPSLWEKIKEGVKKWIKRIGDFFIWIIDKIKEFFNKLFGRNKVVKVSEVQFSNVVNGAKIPEDAKLLIVSCTKDIEKIASSKNVSEEDVENAKNKANEAIETCKDVIAEIENHHINIDEKAPKTIEIETSKLVNIVNSQLDISDIQNVVFKQAKTTLEKSLVEIDKEQDAAKVKSASESIQKAIEAVESMLTAMAKLATEYTGAIAKLTGINKLPEA